MTTKELELDEEAAKLAGTILEYEHAIERALGHLGRVMGSVHASEAERILREQLERTKKIPA